MSYHKNIVKDSNINFHSIHSAKQALPNKINLVNCWEDNINITLGKSTEDGGKYAYIALDRALNEIKDGSIDAIVTAPINKMRCNWPSFPFGTY